MKHPLFWGALVLLVLNDHVLKGAGVLPGWVTGKLSDFSGLIVAPIVLSVLLRARSDRGRAVAFALVGGWFAAANLFAPVAAATSAVASWVGLSWTFWVDPTDLVALAALPVAWQLARRREQSAKKLGERLALGLGVAACVASPPPEPQWTTDAFLVNETGRSLELRVRWVEASVDCEAIRSRYAEALPRDVFGPGTTFLVERDATLPLDRGIAETGGGTPWDVMETPTPHEGNCDVVMLSADGLPDTIVYWSGLSTSVIPDVVENDDDRIAVQDGLRLTSPSEDGPIAVENGVGYFHDAPVELYDGGATCRDYGAITGFDWSDLPSWDRARVRLADVRPTLDGCVHLDLEVVEDFSAGFGEPTSFEAFLCVPPEDFPFHTNAEVRITNGGSTLRMTRDLPMDDGSLWRTGELFVSRGTDRLVEGPFSVALTTVDADCGGVRMACGGFRVPAAGGLTMGSTTRYVHPGDVVERAAADGRRARLRVGRAETMMVTHTACGAGRDQLGQRLEALVVYGEEPR
ncbi:MAG: hypothetical protein H6719_22045 [Sandaracinaceae bacterium]|nr:hypothetical protein [Sandaracinaceae bacterium]